MNEQHFDPRAEEARWDLQDLYLGFDDPAYLRDIEQFHGSAQQFHSRYVGSIADATPSFMEQLLIDYQELCDHIDKLNSFVHLKWATDKSDAEAGKQLQKISELEAQHSHLYSFVVIEIGQCTQEKIYEFVHSPEITRGKHWLALTNQYGAHVLSHEVEHALALKRPYATAAWQRLFDQQHQALRYPVENKQLTLPELQQVLHSPIRNRRKEAALSLGSTLQVGIANQTFVFNTIAADHAATCSLRNYSSWLHGRNLSNEVQQEAVDILVQAVRSSYPLVQTYYTLKQRVLGYDELFDYDRSAPTSTAPTMYTWQQAQQLVCSAYTTFHPTVGEVAQMFFDKRWIDAPIAQGKASGAFSASTVWSAHPYILMNYSGTTRDVQVLAHELGHGIHQYLSRAHGTYEANTPLTIAETASVFGEMIVFEEQMKGANASEQLHLLIGKIDDAIATVFRQIALFTFENELHVQRANGELSTENICDIWMRTQQELYGTSVAFNQGYEYYWAYISHFIHSPGYVYAYAFGELLTRALYEQYQHSPKEFPTKYVELLSAGSSAAPEQLLAPFGLDPNSIEVWQLGIQSIERMIRKVETLLQTSKPQ
jgi:oligoendopeptidase F